MNSKDVPVLPYYVLQLTVNRTPKLSFLLIFYITAGLCKKFADSFTNHLAYKTAVWGM